MPDYSSILTAEEEVVEREAAEMSLPLHEGEGGIWYRHPSPRWQVRDEWTQASPEEREKLDRYRMVMEPDAPFRDTRNTECT